MKLTKLLERLDYKVVAGSDNIEITELVNDSRKVVPGSAFVCISGAVSDGHQYVKDVAERGAAAVIVEKDVEVPEGLTVIKVENTRYALALMSAAYFLQNSFYHISCCCLTLGTGNSNGLKLFSRISEVGC